MSLLDLPIPQRPDYFGPDGAPPGVELRLDAFGSWAASRTKIKPRVCIIHTNGADREGSVQSSINHGNYAVNNTKPHYHVGDKPAKVLRSDLRAIANSTEDWFEAQTGEIDCSFWTIAIESADLGRIAAQAQGYAWPTDCGPFLTSHAVPDAEIVARIFAYESIVHDFPLEVAPTWNGTGCVTHTWPFPHPHYTIAEGKTCPGATKKRQFVEDVLPRAIQIRDAWLNKEPLMRADPRRIFDSRDWGSPFKGGVDHTLPIGAASIANLKLSVVNPAVDGWVAVWGGGPRPANFSVMDFKAGEISNGYPSTAVVDGNVQLYTNVDAHIVVDLMTVQDGA